VELSINLKTVSDQISNDGTVVRLNFVGDNDDIAQVDLTVANLRPLAKFLEGLATKYEVNTNLLFNDPQPPA